MQGSKWFMKKGRVDVMCCVGREKRCIHGRRSHSLIFACRCRLSRALDRVTISNSFSLPFLFAMSTSLSIRHLSNHLCFLIDFFFIF